MSMLRGNGGGLRPVKFGRYFDPKSSAQNRAAAIREGKRRAAERRRAGDDAMLDDMSPAALDEELERLG